jgi:Holliday junction resolvase
MSRSGRASRDKGSRTERAIVRLLQERGLAAERVPLSGAARGRFGGEDIIDDILRRHITAAAEEIAVVLKEEIEARAQDRVADLRLQLEGRDEA